jgi:cytochrome b
MALRTDPTEPGSARHAALLSAMVPVWDPLVRGFHWSLLGLFVIAYASGDALEPLHLLCGYAIVVLLALRVVWGFIGTRHARFSDFVVPPRQVLAYLRQAVRLQAPRHLGHNPAGGAMALVLMAMLAVVCLTGHLTTGGWWGSFVMKAVHVFFVNVTIGLIGLHLIGNLASSLAHGENLARSMVSGLKRRV